MFPRKQTTLFPLLAFAAFAPAYGQTAVDGAIGGSVKDATGASIKGAQVTVRNDGTAAVQTMTTDSSGVFRAVHLAPGTYTVNITAGGFASYQEDRITVTVGSLTTVEPKLKGGAITETVEVTDTLPVINTTSNDFTTTINLKDLNDLPVNNYRWSAYALQAPGVVESGGFGLLSFRGQSTLLNNITIDGADDNQAFFSEERGRTNIGYSTPKSAIQEFQINTSNYTTEYGRAAGGVVNAVTKSGSNQFHGEGYYLDRDSALSSFNDFTFLTAQATPGGPFVSSHVKPTDIRKQDGFAVSGPIFKDKLFFFFALDRYYRDFPIVTVPSSPANFFQTPDPNPGGTFADGQTSLLQTQLKLPTYASARTAYINGQAGLASLLGQAPRFTDQTIFFPKIDYQINGRNHLSLEANRLRFISPSGQQTNVTAQYGTQSIGNVYARVTWGVARLDTFVTPTTSNEVRYQYGRDFEFAGAEASTNYERSTLLNTPAGYVNPNGIPANVSITGAFQFGTATFYPRSAYPDERRWQGTDTVTTVHKNQTFKYGFDFIHTNDLAQNIPNLYGGYQYTSVTNYLTDFYQSQNAATANNIGHYTSYTQGGGRLGFEFQTEDYAGFVQDEWKATPRLSLTFGVRYEYEQSPKAQVANTLLPQTNNFPDDRNNIAPRVGFALDALGSGKTVVRGGWGIFNARVENSTLYNGLVQTGSPLGQLQTPTLTPAGSTANGVTVNVGPRFPQVLPSVAAGAVSNAVFFSPNFQLPQIQQFDLAVDQSVGWNTVVSVSYLGALGRELPDFVDTNLPAPVSITYNVVNNLPNPALPNGAQYTSNFYGGLRPNRAFGAITEIFSPITSSYNAVVVQVQHRASHNVQFQASYTHSHTLDFNENNTTFSNTSSVLDPANFQLEYGNGNQNIPNRVVGTAVYNTPSRFHGWKAYALNNYELAPSFSAQNGAQYSATINGNPNGVITSAGVLTGVAGGYTGTGGATRIPGLERNTFRYPRDILFDLRGSKRFLIKERYNLEFLAESFNLPNHQNVTAVNSTAYTLATATTNGVARNTLTQFQTAPFGQATNSNNNNIYTPRQIQLGVRLQF